MKYSSNSCRPCRVTTTVIRWMLTPAFLIVTLGAQPSLAAQKWSATVSGDEATAADCSNCDEDIRVLLSCKRGNADVQVSLMLLEQREDSFAGKPTVISVTSAAGKIVLAGRYDNPGLIGPYPQLTVQLNSPLLNLFSHSNSVTFSADKQKAKISMSGSKAAIAKMLKACR